MPALPEVRLEIDGQVVSSAEGWGEETLHFRRLPADRDWRQYVSTADYPGGHARIGPLTSVLGSNRPPIIFSSTAPNTDSPLTIIFPSRAPTLSRIAERLAHDLFTYLGLDVRLVDDAEALDPVTAGEIAKANVVAIGGPKENGWLRTLQPFMHTPVKWQAPGTFTVGNRIFLDKGEGKFKQRARSSLPPAHAM